jgi:hypothetical protein
MTSDITSSDDPTGSGENSYPDDSAVYVRFPLTREQRDGDRAAWPWLPGTIVQRCGPDEWDVQATEIRNGEIRTRGTGPIRP